MNFLSFHHNLVVLLISLGSVLCISHVASSLEGGVHDGLSHLCSLCHSSYNLVDPVNVNNLRSFFPSALPIPQAPFHGFQREVEDPSRDFSTEVYVS
jgi:hypothetical protein